MVERSAAAVVREFIEAIHRGDVAALLERTTEDHLFVDSLGTSLSGREVLREAWTAYLGMVPDYRIEVAVMIAEGERVAAFGVARGTFAPGGQRSEENRWRTPGAWLARVRAGKIAEWRVFADNEPIRAIMRREPET